MKVIVDAASQFSFSEVECSAPVEACVLLLPLLQYSVFILDCSCDHGHLFQWSWFQKASHSAFGAGDPRYHLQKFFALVEDLDIGSYLWNVSGNFKFELSE